MFHIGVATHHPPLPEPGQLSEMGIDFIRQCLTIDPVQRPTAVELSNSPLLPPKVEDEHFKNTLDMIGEFCI